jgi:hypothetical protein
MRLEGELEAQEGTAPPLRRNELQQRLDLITIAGEAEPVAIRKLGNLFDRG